MNIYEFQKNFDELMKSIESLPQNSLELAWTYFKQTVREHLDEPYCDEIGFSAGRDMFAHNAYSIHFGRIIDSNKRYSWGVAEIDCYFSFEMDEELRNLVKQPSGSISIEDAFCYNAEDQEEIAKKIEHVFTVADNNLELGGILRGKAPTKSLSSRLSIAEGRII